MSKAAFKSTFSDYNLIYVFNCPYEDHKGAVKVGKASISAVENVSELTPCCQKLNAAAEKRIKEYTSAAGIRYDLLYTELAINNKGESFNDYAVHDVLMRSGIKKKVFEENIRANEWFLTDTETVINAIKAVREGKSSLRADEKTSGHNPIHLRTEQNQAVKDTIAHFKKYDKMLWNAKMRFGKTVSALTLFKEMDKASKAIIITHRPDVLKGWYEDFEKIFYSDSEYKFGSKTLGENLNSLKSWIDAGHKGIYFASIQDLRGSQSVGGSFDKNDEIFRIDWDLLIVDEAHEGTQTQLGEAVVNELKKPSTKLLQLSGTPFNLFDDDISKGVFTWDYIMEQRAKEEWKEELLGPNPYAGLPRMNILTYDISDVDPRYSSYTEDKYFNFREFFRVGENGSFLHHDDVLAFLNLLCKKDDESNYPFSTEEYRKNFKHTFWMLPGVKEARALSEMLHTHPILGAFHIVNVAGEGDNSNEYDYEREQRALDQVKNAIAKYPNGTITLSCGRLSTGVTVPEWTAVFMLAGSYSTAAASYMQTIFRVQSPANINGRIKEECYVFDFAPDRTLKVLAEAVKVSAKAGKTTSNDRKIMEDFLHFCPIISVSGSRMSTYDVSGMLQQLKRAYIDRAVRTGFEDNNLFNQELLNLDDLDMAKFEALKKIVGSKSGDNTEKEKKVIINETGMDGQTENTNNEPKEPKSLTPEEIEKKEKDKEAKKRRDAARSILRAISIRIPMLIYGSDTPIYKDIDIEGFISSVDDISWKEFMPNGVDKEVFKQFAKYFDMEIFIGAGNEIRNRVRFADKLEPTSRVKFIANMFASFKNPDKETVLTPWRVVNMHMGDCLGGDNFYDEKYQEPIPEGKGTRYINIPDVTDSVFGPKDTKILEINSKSGLYPLYITYTIWKKCCTEAGIDCSKLSELSDKDDLLLKVRDIWDDVVQKNIYIICKTPMAKSITQRTLCGYRDVKINAHAFENLITMIKDGKSEKFIEKAKTGSTYNVKNKEKDMKFNAIVGNPPYQETKDYTSDNPVYHLFMDVAFQLSKKVSFITPARYLFNAGKTPKEWNKKVLNDEHMKVVWYKSKSTDVFPNVDIKGGVAVMFRDTDKKFGKLGVFTSFKELNSICKKVIEHKDFESLEDIIFLQNKFNLAKLYSDYPSYKALVGSNGKEKRLTTSIFETLNIFSIKPPKDKAVQILGLINNNRLYRWCPEKFIEKHENLNKYKVILPKSNGSGALGEVLSTPLVGEPLVGYTQSFIGIGAFDTLKEAEAALKYVKSKFARVMLGVLKVTQDNNKETWKYVPLQDFTDKSDIDWSESVENIDKQLYKKYGLTEEEISFIEKMIKPMK